MELSADGGVLRAWPSIASNVNRSAMGSRPGFGTGVGVEVGLEVGVGGDVGVGVAGGTMEARVAVGVAVGSTGGALVGVAICLGVAVDRTGVGVGKAVGVGVGVETDTNRQLAIERTQANTSTVAGATFPFVRVTIASVPWIRRCSIAPDLPGVNRSSACRVRHCRHPPRKNLAYAEGVGGRVEK